MFDAGNVYITASVSEYMKQHSLDHDIVRLINRHIRGDWGELPEDDKEANDLAIKQNTRILSKHKLKDEYVYIITEADRSYTTILFPHEY